MEFTTEHKQQIALQFYSYIVGNNLQATWTEPTSPRTLKIPYSSAMSVILSVKNVIPHAGNVFNAVLASGGESTKRYRALEGAVVHRINKRFRASSFNLQHPPTKNWVLAYVAYQKSAINHFQGGCCRELSALVLDKILTMEKECFSPYTYVSYFFFCTHDFVVLSKEREKAAIISSSDALVVDAWPMWPYPVFLKDSNQKAGLTGEGAAEHTLWVRFKLGKEYHSEEWRDRLPFPPYQDRNTLPDMGFQYCPVSWKDTRPENIVTTEDKIESSLSQYSSVSALMGKLRSPSVARLLSTHKKTTPAILTLPEI